MADEAPKSQRPGEARQERERRYERITDALDHGLDRDWIAQSLGISRRQLTPMIGAARRWRARQDAAAADVQGDPTDDMLDELCKAVCEHGGPATAEHLAGLVGRSRTEPGWSLTMTAHMLHEAVTDGLVREVRSGAFELPARGAGRCPPGGGRKTRWRWRSTGARWCGRRTRPRA